MAEVAPTPSPTTSHASKSADLRGKQASKPIPQHIPPIPTIRPTGPQIPPSKSNALPPIVIAPCAEGQTPERLDTGARIKPDEGTSGESTLEVRNGTSLDAAVRLVDNSTNKTSRFVYIRATNDYTITGIEPGTYSLRFATGSEWVTSCREFQRDEDIKEFEKQLVFNRDVSIVYEGDQRIERWRSTKVSATLNAVPLGNAPTRKIDRKQFLEGHTGPNTAGDVRAAPAERPTPHRGRGAGKRNLHLAAPADSWCLSPGKSGRAIVPGALR